MDTAKAEYFAGAFEGLCIFLAAASIWYASIESIMQNKPLPEGSIGLLVSCLATAINLAWACCWSMPAKNRIPLL